MTESIRRKVTVADLQLAGEYHQGVLERTVALIAQKWNRRLAGTIVVAEREDGALVIVDGVQRVEAARRVGVKQMEADVRQGLTLRGEAEQFLSLNTRRRR